MGTMTTSSPAAPQSIGIAGQSVASRVVSLDVFRGLTMATMIFVNDLASVHGLPAWTYHMPAQVDAMTYVDMVFPAFLFIVGMSLPLAVRQRLRRDPSLASLAMHVLLRSLGLLALGLVLANAEQGDATRMHLQPGAWALLALLGAVLLWAVYSRSLPRRVTLACRGAGGVLLVGAFAMFRRVAPAGHDAATAGHTRWIDFSYPEILGLIGLTYFAVCLLYIPLRARRWAPLGCFLALLGLNCACSAHWISLRHVSIYAWPFDNGAMAAIAMAGVVCSGIFLEEAPQQTAARRLTLGLLFGAACLVAGWLLTPLGISKIRATPTWSLWSVGASALLFTAIYWLCDVRRHTRWAALLRPAGANTLLTYLLPDFFFYASVLWGFEAVLGHWDAGAPGILRAFLFTVAMLLLAAALTRARVRLQL